jgi:hypothetical protein
VRKLVEVDESLVANATTLREFFVRKDGGQSPYQNVIRTGQGLRSDLGTDLDLVARQEPVRAAEIRRMIPPNKVFEDRSGVSAEKIPSKIAKTIDEWIALVPAFRKDALTPEPKALLKTRSQWGTPSNRPASELATEGDTTWPPPPSPWNSLSRATRSRSTHFRLQSTSATIRHPTCLCNSANGLRGFLKRRQQLHEKALSWIRLGLERHA